jgi:hypothetical protein
MRESMRVWLPLICAMGIGCTTQNIGDGGPDGGDAGFDGGDGGGCSLVAVAASLVGDAGVDCGSFRVPMSSQIDDGGWDAGPLETGVACALSAQDAGLPFLLVVGFSGVDFTDRTGWLRTPDGQSLTLTQQEYTNCYVVSLPWELQQTACSAFVPSLLATTDSDAGIVPGLLCQDAGMPVTVCTGCP